MHLLWGQYKEENLSFQVVDMGVVNSTSKILDSWTIEIFGLLGELFD